MWALSTIISGQLSSISLNRQVHDQQAPWPSGGPPPVLPRATLVIVAQLGVVCALLGLLNFSVFTTVRKHLHSDPALQEKIVSAMLVPLLIGDVSHISVTLWAVGDLRWEPKRWTPMLWTTVLLGLSLLVPRVAWQMGIGRYVHARDSVRADKKS